MKSIVNVIAAFGVAISSVPVLAMPIQASPEGLDAGPTHAAIVSISDRADQLRGGHHVRWRHSAPLRLPYQPDGDAARYEDNGGYVVNRYGYGNYVGGPGGFAGYPAGSGAAFVYRQKQNWKCEYAPETC